MIDFHLELNGKNVRVGLMGLPIAKPKPVVQYATGAGEVQSRKMITGINKAANVSFDSLRDGDPELDLNLAGADASDLTPAYFDPQAEHAKPVTDFKDIDVIYGPDDSEKARRDHVNRKPNINETHPVKVTRRLPLAEVLTSFVPKQTLQVVHTDGLNFEFLRDFAKDLLVKQEAAVLGAGAKANLPLVLRNASSPHRAFLIGAFAETDRYQLLLMLSDQELKLPEQSA
jgi:hypothetical protein